jgi:hypothetical protein
VDRVGERAKDNEGNHRSAFHCHFLSSNPDNRRSASNPAKDRFCSREHQQVNPIEFPYRFVGRLCRERNQAVARRLIAAGATREGRKFVKRTLIVMALLLGAPLAARANIAPLIADGGWSEALNIRRTQACFDKRGGQAFVPAQTTHPCLRYRPLRRTALERAGDGRIACNADVLRSEELAGAPIFYHYVRSALLVTPPGRPAFETTVENLMPWQVPPPRKGQRLRLWCDPASPSALTFH